MKYLSNSEENVKECKHPYKVAPRLRVSKNLWIITYEDHLWTVRGENKPKVVSPTRAIEYLKENNNVIETSDETAKKAFGDDCLVDKSAVLSNYEKSEYLRT